MRYLGNKESIMPEINKLLYEKVSNIMKYHTDINR